MRYAFIFLGIVLFAQPLTGFAQFTADYQTNVISSGVTSNWNGNYYVGDTTVGDVLLIETGGALILSSSGYGYVGNASGASNNVVLISGSGSLWKVPITLSVGGGSCNSLVVSNAGRLVTGWATIGFLNSSASNRVSVIGSGSVWTNSSAFSVGEYGGPETSFSSATEPASSIVPSRIWGDGNLEVTAVPSSRGMARSGQTRRT